MVNVGRPAVQPFVWSDWFAVLTLCVAPPDDLDDREYDEHGGEYNGCSYPDPKADAAAATVLKDQGASKGTGTHGHGPQVTRENGLPLKCADDDEYAGRQNANDWSGAPVGLADGGIVEAKASTYDSRSTQTDGKQLSRAWHPTWCLPGFVVCHVQDPPKSGSANG